MKTNHQKYDLQNRNKENIGINRMTRNNNKNEPYKFISNTRKRYMNQKTIPNLKITRTLMVIQICYLITTLPTFIIIILQLSSIFYESNSDYDFQSLMTIAQTLMYLNKSTIVFFYALLGKNLRKELIEKLSVCFKKKTNGEANRFN